MKNTKKVDSKAALRRAWRFVKVKGLDKATAFDLAWKMERGELPKKTTLNGNPVVKALPYSVKETINALTNQMEDYSAKRRVEGMKMDNYLNPKQRAAYTRLYNKADEARMAVMQSYGLLLSEGAFIDDKDYQVQVVFVK